MAEQIVTTETYECVNGDAVLPVGSVLVKTTGVVEFDGETSPAETAYMTADGWLEYQSDGEAAPLILTCPNCTQYDNMEAGWRFIPDAVPAK